MLRKPYMELNRHGKSKRRKSILKHVESNFPPSTQTSRKVVEGSLKVSSEDVLYSIKSEVIENSNDIEQIKINQKTILGVLTELVSTTKRIETKLDSFLVKFEEQQSNSHMPPEERILGTLNDDIDVMSTLPVGIDGFSRLNEKIGENGSFRHRLKRILMTAGGKESKANVANVLRKLITDDVGEKYSLTGKASITGLVKESFEKTATYQLVLEICFDTFRDTKENIVREAVSDWLMQSKFRKNRREKRMNLVKQEVDIISQE